MLFRTAKGKLELTPKQELPGCVWSSLILQVPLRETPR